MIYLFPSWTYLRAKWRLLFIHVFSLTGCGSFNSANKTLTSPGYPSNYPNYMDCEYWVPIPPGMAARIDFITFDVESHLFCRLEWDINQTIYVEVNIDYHCLTGENRFRLLSRGKSNLHIFWPTQLWLFEDQQRAKPDFWFFLWKQKWPECHSNWTVCCFNLPFRWLCKWQWLQTVFLLCFTR